MCARRVFFLSWRFYFSFLSELVLGWFGEGNWSGGLENWKGWSRLDTEIWWDGEVLQAYAWLDIGKLAGVAQSSHGIWQF